MALQYPNKHDIEVYKEILQDLEFAFLPPIDDRWAEDMYAMFELVRMLPQCSDAFYFAAANLFFKVIKNHRRIDGNKRSAICCLVLFTAMNNRTNQVAPHEIEKMALEVAASQGNTGDRLIPELERFFEARIVENTEHGPIKVDK